MIGANYNPLFSCHTQAMTTLGYIVHILSHLEDISYAAFWCGILKSNGGFLLNDLSLKSCDIYHGWTEMVTQRGKGSHRSSK